MHLISGRPCSLMAVVCPGCCRVRSSAEAHGIVLSAITLSLLCLLGGSVWWWCRRQGTKRRADQQVLVVPPDNRMSTSDMDFGLD